MDITNNLKISEKNAELIANLCSLRSGLSVISIKADQIKEKNDKTRKLKMKILNSYNELSNYLFKLSGSLFDNNRKQEYFNSRNYLLTECGVGKYDVDDDVIYVDDDEEVDGVDILSEKFELFSKKLSFNNEKLTMYLQSLITQYNDKLNKLNKEISDTEKKLKALKKPIEPKKTVKINPPPIWKLLIAFFGLAGILEFLSIGIDAIRNNFVLFVFIYVIVWVILLIIWTIIKVKYNSGCIARYNYKKEFENYEKDYRLYDWELKTLSEEKESFKCDINLNEYKDKLNDFEKLKKESKVEAHKIFSEIEAISNECNDIKLGLNEQFDSIITESDWQNIDLIIFNMTSGRADSFKESLILVDGVRQTEAIIGAIENATAAICRTLYNGFSSLGSLITNSFDRLSNTIQVNMSDLRYSVNNVYSSNMRVHNATEKLINQNEKISEQTERLITATELGNALQEKANETSYQLYSDLRYTSNIIKK